MGDGQVWAGCGERGRGGRRSEGGIGLCVAGGAVRSCATAHTM